MKKKIEAPKETYSFLTKVPYATFGNEQISAGEIIKIDGIQGTKFRFDSHVTNTRTGDTWVDVYELEGDQPVRARAFHTSKVRLVKKRGRRTRTSS